MLIERGKCSRPDHLDELAAGRSRMLQRFLGRRAEPNRAPVAGLANDGLIEELLTQLLAWASPPYRQGVLESRIESYRALSASARRMELPRARWNHRPASRPLPQ